MAPATPGVGQGCIPEDHAVFHEQPGPSSNEGFDLSGDLPPTSITEAPLSDIDAVELARVLSALADPVRLRLMSFVASNPDVSSSDVERPLGRSQPTISHYCRVLVEAGLLIGERRGRWTRWRMAPSGLATTWAALDGKPSRRSD